MIAGEGEIKRVEIGRVTSSLVAMGTSNMSAADEVSRTWGVGVGVACGKEEVKSSDRS